MPTARPKAKCIRWNLVHKRFLFTVTWETSDVEMEGGRWPWRLMAKRYATVSCQRSLQTLCMHLKLTQFLVWLLENLPLRCWVLEQQKCLQPCRRQDWVWQPRDQVADLLEHTLLQDLFRYEDRSADQVPCHQETGQLPALTDRWRKIPPHLSLGRNTWKTLIGSQASLQTGCNKEGFNVASSSSYAKARIGVLGNDQRDCATCDSKIGFGTGGATDDSNTCGDNSIKGYTADNGGKSIKAMGYILVQ